MNKALRLGARRGLPRYLVGQQLVLAKGALKSGARLDAMTTLCVLGPATALALAAVAFAVEWRRGDFTFSKAPWLAVCV